MPDLEVLRPAENARALEPEGMTDLEAERQPSEPDTVIEVERAADLQTFRQAAQLGTALKVERATDLQAFGQALQFGTIPENEGALDPRETSRQFFKVGPAEVDGVNETQIVELFEALRPVLVQGVFGNELLE